MLFLIGSGLLQLGFHARLGAIRSTSQISARAAADAGLAQALYEMNSQFNPNNACDPPWAGVTDSGSLSDSYGNAAYDYTITGGCPNYEIISTGTTMRGQKTVHAIVRVLTEYEYAIIVQDSIELYPGSVVDGYNSANPADPDTYVKIGTNSILEDMIVLYPDCAVDGDVLVGFGGQVDTVIKQQPGATTGPQYPLPSEVPLEENALPLDWAGVPMPDLDFDPCGVATITQSGDYIYDSIHLAQGHVLRVGDLLNVANVRIYIPGDLSLNQDAELRITGIPGEENASSWSSLRIYLDGELTAHQGSALNNETLKPGQFRLVGTGTGPNITWRIHNAGDFYGVYDAPNADIQTFTKADIYGAVIGKSFRQNAKCNIYYDEDLRQPIEGPVGFAIERWWEE
jgi:hypothetical protein